MLFFRILDNTLFSAGDVKRVGWDVSEPMYIPDEYLENGEFVVMRTCHGIGDWCIISALPRLLKEKYPNCKVYVPSQKMLKSVFGNMLDTWGYGVYDASNVSYDVFQNNPYVDEFIDSIEGEIFHDHYRIYDVNNSEIPLVTQMLKFWQFKDSELLDTTPDIYFSDSDKFNVHINDMDYGYVGVSSTYGNTADTQLLVDKIKEYGDMTWMYYGEQPIEETNLSFIKDVINIKPMGLSLRQQMYLRCNAKVNVGNESGTTLWCSKYSDTYVLGNKTYGPLHGKNNEGKPRKDPFKSGNFVERINYMN
tara:strand:- start:3040 stop:3957 length:918 start_codon:yes stop_codon:yes gene_type:complete